MNGAHVASNGKQQLLMRANAIFQIGAQTSVENWRV
jgi:hypothetical protein